MRGKASQLLRLGSGGENRTVLVCGGEGGQKQDYW
jgi:hypothetical protein